tara:strand:- start:7972 stop:8679 length:708 start_codon:yes stop_codon:yes gene_type:complete
MKISKKYLRKIILEEAAAVNEIDSGVMTAQEGAEIIDAMLEALEQHNDLLEKDPSFPVQEGFKQTLASIRSVAKQTGAEGDEERDRHYPDGTGDGVGGGAVKPSTIHDLDIPKMSRMLSEGWKAVKNEIEQTKAAYESFMKWEQQDFAKANQQVENVKKAYERVDSVIAMIARQAGVAGAKPADKVKGGAGVMGNPMDSKSTVPKVPDVTLQERKITKALKKLNKIIEKRNKKRK